MDWCEEELCSWVVNPADTWSNVAYLACGLLMIVQTRTERSDGLALFGPASILVGILSLVYHASYTYFFQFFDFVGMFIFCFAVITANALRLGWISPARRLHFYVAGVLVFSALVPVFNETPIPIQALVALLIATILAQEVTVALRRTPSDPPTPRLFFFVALALLAGAGAASLADITRTWCQPENHWIQGHAVWHVLSAASLYALFRFYRQIAAARPA
ncbi:MAG: ceramidase domain-containing protein [Myxococcota bacterium]|nr:ceramidase domain-containing protein [Myxococcota bacterium]